MRRLSFLPLFFLGLSVTFVVVLALRLRRDAQEGIPTATTAPSNPAAAPSPPRLVISTSENASSPARIAAGPAGVEGRPEAGVARTTPAPPKQPAIARALAPPVHALSGKRSSAPPAPKPPPQRPSQSQPVSLTEARGSSRGHDQQGAKDPDSDTTPPQLLSIEFVPPQVHDGEESTVAITATDDLSGVRGISGTISSPTGKALQGFATQHEGESNRYLGRVFIPKNAEQGTWHVRFLNLSDNASNSVTLSDGQGTIPPSAVLRVVSSDSDSTPPSLKNIWVDRRAMRGGEKNIVYVEAVDDNSGVNLVSAVFQSPSKLARIGAGCQRGDGDVWRCELAAPACLDCGDWQLEQVTLQDKANNLATFRQDNPIVQAVKINIQGDSCDSTAPTLQSLTLNNNDVTMGANGTMVAVTIAVSDDLCGVSGASGQFSGPGAGSGGVFPLQRTGEGTWVGHIQLDPHAARGVWRINSIQLTDQGYNLRIYYANDPLLQNGVFHVR